MSKGSLQIDLLEHHSPFRLMKNPEYLNALYAHYKKIINQIEESSATQNPLKTAIIVIF